MSIMVEVAPGRYVNEATANKLGLQGTGKSYVTEDHVTGREPPLRPKKKNAAPMPEKTPPAKVIMDATFDLPREEPPAPKTAVREWLASMMKGATVTKIPTVPQPEPRAWKPKPKPQAVNDNEEAIPLCEALVRDKRSDDAAMVRRYRYLVDVAGLPQEDAQAEVGEQGMDLARRTDFAESNGAMRDHGVRVSAKVAISYGNRNAVTTDDIPRRTQAPARPTIGEDSIIAHMDAKAIIGPLRAAVGPLLDVFEDAAIGGMTMTKIGELRGFKGKQASAAGKALVYAAVDVVREAWNREERLTAVQASKAEIRVQASIDATYASNLIYFGKDITKRPGTIYGRSKAA
ncbi:hypothetical protein [Brucella intermedia]|uniref:hypothetical protein n=1 Tax=Brucella intermedia TaxID=94625 RepID=UPI00165CFD38|nr:hypothetical protein [Brucella intermedia]QNQ40056.1 hypothetical protein IAR37_12010 [Brucella intermedia]